MNLLNVFNQIVILFSILILGMLMKKFKAVGDGFGKDLTDFILNISLPALIIKSMSFEFSRDLLFKSGQVLVISIITYALSIAFALILSKILKLEGAKKGVYQFLLIFSNVGFMGYPVANAIYGETGVFYTTIYNLIFGVLVWTVGIIVINGGKGEGKSSLSNLYNPGTISIIVGFIMFIFSIRLPGPIDAAVDMVGSLTTPLSMILVGFILADFSIRKVFTSPMVFFMSFLRLIAIPLAVLALLMPFIKDPMVLGIPVLMCAMPAATNTVMLAGKFGGDTYTASQSVFITTLLSIATIPLVVYIVGIV